MPYYILQSQSTCLSPLCICYQLHQWSKVYKLIFH